MKRLAAMAMVMGLAVTLCAQPALEDIASYEAAVIDETTGEVLATGGPWDWEYVSIQMLVGSFGGPDRAILVQCRDAVGTVIYGGMITGADLTVPFSPFEPPDPSGLASLVFYAEDYTLAVFLNDRYFVGDIVLLPEIPSVKTVDVDIKPGSSVNLFKVGSKGMLPVAVLGSSDLDVSKIDTASIRLSGISPVRMTVDDVQADGFADAVFHFRDQDIAVLLNGAADGDVLDLELTGTLLDGTEITGTDSITVNLKKTR